VYPQGTSVTRLTAGRTTLVCQRTTTTALLTRTRNQQTTDYRLQTTAKVKLFENMATATTTVTEVEPETVSPPSSPTSPFSKNHSPVSSASNKGDGHDDNNEDDNDFRHSHTGETQDSDVRLVEWEPPSSLTRKKTTGPRETAILALQAAAVAAKEFDATFDIRDQAREALVPLVVGDELVIGGEPLRHVGYFDDYQLKAVRVLLDLIEEGNFESASEQARERLMERSIDGHYGVKLLQPGLMDMDYGAWAAEDFITETRLLMNLAPHPHVAQIYGLNRGGIDTLLENGRHGFFIITDRMSETLTERLTAWKDKRGYRALSPGQAPRRFVQRLEVALDIASALLYLHDRKLVYHVRPEKVGFSAKQGVVKLCQFGQCRQDGQNPQARSLTKTQDMDMLRYTAPEVLCTAPANTSSDAYSFGIVLWEIMSLKIPYMGWDRATHLDRVVQNHVRPPMNRQWPAAVQTLLQGAWHPHLRLTMRKVHAQLVEILNYHEALPVSPKKQQTASSSKVSASVPPSPKPPSLTASVPPSPKPPSGGASVASEAVSHASSPRLEKKDCGASADTNSQASSSPKKKKKSSAFLAQIAQAMEQRQKPSDSPSVACKSAQSVASKKAALDTSARSPSRTPSTSSRKVDSAKTSPTGLPTVPSLASPHKTPVKVAAAATRRRSPSPRRASQQGEKKPRPESPRINRERSPRQRAQRRSSTDVSSKRDVNSSPTKSTQGPVKGTRVHRSASISHLPEDQAAPLRITTNFVNMLLDSPRNRDADYEDGNDNDEARNFYGYDQASSTAVPPEDASKSPSQNRRRSGPAPPDPRSTGVGGIRSGYHQKFSSGGSGHLPQDNNSIRNRSGHSRSSSGRSFRSQSKTMDRGDQSKREGRMNDDDSTRSPSHSDRNRRSSLGGMMGSPRRTLRRFSQSGTHTAMDDGSGHASFAAPSVATTNTWSPRKLRQRRRGSTGPMDQTESMDESLLPTPPQVYESPLQRAKRRLSGVGSSKSGPGYMPELSPAPDLSSSNTTASTAGTTEDTGASKIARIISEHAGEKDKEVAPEPTVESPRRRIRLSSMKALFRGHSCSAAEIPSESPVKSQTGSDGAPRSPSRFGRIRRLSIG
jgi:hypothetical protein